MCDLKLCAVTAGSSQYHGHRKSTRILFCLILTLAFFLLSCSEKTNEVPQGEQRITIQEIPQVARKVKYFGIISKYNPRLMLEQYQPLMDYLTENTPYRFELKLGKSFDSAVQDLCEGVVHAAWLGGVTYLQAQKLCDAVAVLKPLNKSNLPFHHSVTVVRNDSPLQELHELHGKSIAFAAIHSTSGNLVPRAYLASAGVRVRDLDHFDNLHHDESVAKAVLSGRFDAGTVKDVVAHAYLDKGLRVLYVSDPIPSEPIVVRQDCDIEFVNSLKAALVKINPRDPDQTGPLSKWHDEFRYGFSEATHADYEGLRETMKLIPERCSVSCHLR